MRYQIQLTGVGNHKKFTKFDIKGIDQSTLTFEIGYLSGNTLYFLLVSVGNELPLCVVVTPS